MSRFRDSEHFAHLLDHLYPSLFIAFFAGAERERENLPNEESTLMFMLVAISANYWTLIHLIISSATTVSFTTTTSTTTTASTSHTLPLSLIASFGSAKVPIKQKCCRW